MELDHNQVLRRDLKPWTGKCSQNSLSQKGSNFFLTLKLENFECPWPWFSFWWAFPFQGLFFVLSMPTYQRGMIKILFSFLNINLSSDRGNNFTVWRNPMKINKFSWKNFSRKTENFLWKPCFFPSENS